eukprot:5784617-Pyramimonas_sp.AAC.1
MRKADRGARGRLWGHTGLSGADRGARGSLRGGTRTACAELSRTHGSSCRPKKRTRVSKWS